MAASKRARQRRRFEPSAEIAATLEGMEERINRWNPAKHSRRKKKSRMKIKITERAE